MQPEAANQASTGPIKYVIVQDNSSRRQPTKRAKDSEIMSFSRNYIFVSPVLAWLAASGCSRSEE